MDGPSLGKRRVNHGDLEIFLQHLDDAHGLPTAALDINAIGAWIFPEQRLDVRVQPLDRNLRDLIEWYVDRLHRQRLEAGRRHVVEHDLVLQLV